MDDRFSSVVLVQTGHVYFRTQFSEDEVYHILMGADGNKDLALNEFRLNFLAMFKENLMDLFNHFLEGDEFDHSFSLSIITIVLKVTCLSSLNDFRHISLLRCVYKLVAHVLVARHRRVSCHWSRTPNQHLFWVRCIYNRLDVASKVVDMMSKDKEVGVHPECYSFVVC